MEPFCIFLFLPCLTSMLFFFSYFCHACLAWFSFSHIFVGSILYLFLIGSKDKGIILEIYGCIPKIGKCICGDGFAPIIHKIEMIPFNETQNLTKLKTTLSSLNKLDSDIFSVFGSGKCFKPTGELNFYFSKD